MCAFLWIINYVHVYYDIDDDDEYDTNYDYDDGDDFKHEHHYENRCRWITGP